MDTLDTFRKLWRFQRHILPLSHLWTFPRSASLRVVSLQHRSNNFSTGDNFAEKYFSSKYVNLIFSFLFYREFSVSHLIQYQQKKRLSERNLKRNSTQKAGIMADSRPGKSSYARLSPAFRLSLSLSLSDHSWTTCFIRGFPFLCQPLFADEIILSPCISKEWG